MQEKDRRDLLKTEMLFKEHYQRLCSLANKILRDSNASADIVQDVFFKIWKKREQTDLSAMPNGYLYKAVINASLDYLEKHKKTVLSPEHDTELSDGHKTENDVSALELTRIIEEALEKLPAKCRAIFVLSRYEGMKHKEIASHLNISIKTVEGQIAIALERLKKELAPYIKNPTILMILFLLFN